MRKKVAEGMRALLFVLAASVVGCGPEPTVPPSGALPAEERLSQERFLGDDVARGISGALEANGLRSRLLHAFRESPYVEHKLVLQEFVQTPLGRQVVVAAASALGVSENSFTAQINALPQLDLYVLGRNARKNWHGEDVLAVALTTEMRVQPPKAFTSNGVVSYAEAKAKNVVLLLQPAESKGFRANPQKSAEGSVIQDEDDGEIGVQVIRYSANGDSVVTDYQRDPNGAWVPWNRSSLSLRFLDECGDSCGGGGSPPPASTNVVYIMTRSVCDMDCIAGNEFEFRAKERAANGSVLSTGTARITGVESGYITATFWTGSVPMINATANGDGRYIDVDVVETDPWPNPDDNFDPNPLLYSASDKYRDFHIGDNRAWTFCTRGEPVCRELTINFNWN